MADEIPPVEVPQDSEIPLENQAPENPPVQAAPPPAAQLVVSGEKSEREIELEQQLSDTTGKLTDAERKILEREREIAEREREIQELKKIPKPAPEKSKRKFIETFLD